MFFDFFRTEDRQQCFNEQLKEALEDLKKYFDVVISISVNVPLNAFKGLL